MTPEEFAAIERRWSNYGGMGNGRDADDYTDAGCRLFAQYAFADMPILAAAVRVRDQTIADLRGELTLFAVRVKSVADDLHKFDSFADGLVHAHARNLAANTYNQLASALAALDPQETP